VVIARIVVSVIVDEFKALRFRHVCTRPDGSGQRGDARRHRRHRENRPAGYVRYYEI